MRLLLYRALLYAFLIEYLDLPIQALSIAHSTVKHAFLSGSIPSASHPMGKLLGFKAKLIQRV